MNMIVSKQMLRLLSEQLKKPLGLTEVRRATGMGELYVTHLDVVPEEEGFNFKKQYVLEIDGVAYQFHARYVDETENF